MKAHKVIGVMMMGIAGSAISSQVIADTNGYLLDEVLYEDKCTSCHGADIFTSEDRKIKSLRKLKNQVRLCSVNAKTKWSDKKNMAVAYYLNREFYKF